MADPSVNFVLRADYADYSRGIKQAEKIHTRAVSGMAAATTKAQRTMVAGNAQLQSSFRSVGDEALRLKPIVAGIAAAIGAQQVTQYADAWLNAQNQLRQVTGSTEELKIATDSLFAVAQQSRSEFGSTATLYSQLARSTAELGTSQADLEIVTRAINQSFALSGATAQEAQGSITQLAQALASGVLRGDEFNSVAEQAPGILRAIAEETGRTTGELRGMAANGEITAELIIRAMKNAAGSIEENFNQSFVTFNQQLVLAKNNLTLFVGQSEQLNSIVGSAGAVIVTLSENIGTLGTALGAAAVIFAGRYLQGLTDSAVKTYRKIQANRALITSELELAKIANQRAIQEQAAAQRMLAVNKSAAIRSQAITNLAKANGKLIATENALAAATTRYTAAATAAGVVSRALGAAMTLLGGPVGLALLAAYGLYEFATSSTAAADSAKEAQKHIDAMVNGYANVDMSIIRAEIDKTREAIDALNNTARNQQPLAVRGIKGNQGDNGLDDTQKQELAELTRQLGILEKAYAKAEEAKKKLFNDDQNKTRLKSEKEFNDSVTKLRQQQTKVLRTELSKQSRLLAQQKSQLKSFQDDLKGILKEFDSVSDSLGGTKTPDYLDVAITSGKAQSALDSGDAEKALDLAQKARDAAKEAFDAGNISQFNAENQIKIARGIAEAAGAQIEEAKKEDVTSLESTVQALTDKLAKIESVELAFNEDLAKQNADSILRVLQQKIDSTPLTAVINPVMAAYAGTGGTSGNAVAAAAASTATPKAPAKIGTVEFSINGKTSSFTGTADEIKKMTREARRVQK